MKTLLSILFYVFMAGTTATVGKDLGNPVAEKNKTIKPVEDNPANISNASTAAPVTEIKHGFKAFGVRQAGNNLVATWAAQSPQINSFILQYSTDGKLFQPVAQISYTGAVAYKYTGTNGAKPGYYRIESIKTGGFIEHSQIKKMRTPR